MHLCSNTSVCLSRFTHAATLLTIIGFWLLLVLINMTYDSFRFYIYIHIYICIYIYIYIYTQSNLDIEPLFVHLNLWRCIEGGHKPNYCIIGNLYSQTFTGAEWGWRHIGVRLRALARTHTHTRARARTHTHTRARAHTHTHTHTVRERDRKRESLRLTFEVTTLKITIISSKNQLGTR